MPDFETILKEVNYRTSRSGGSGGQHVNKVETRVELLFAIRNSEGLSVDEKDILSEKLSNRIDSFGVLHLTCETERSQLANKRKVTTLLISTFKEALKKVKPRKKTKPSRAAVKKRIDAKKKLGLKKQNRRKPNPSDEG